jgi:hypothetical protein
MCRRIIKIGRKEKSIFETSNESFRLGSGGKSLGISSSRFRLDPELLE